MIATRRASAVRTVHACVFFAALAGAPASAQTLEIAGYEKVSETRVTRTVSEFTYRVLLTNDGPAAAGATAVATSLSAATAVMDGTVTFGPVPSGATVVSLDTFTFRHDRTVPFDFAVIQWVLGGAPANTPPVANAGPDQTAGSRTLVHLDGSGSTDADGDQLTFAWSFESLPPGSGAVLADPSSVAPSFVADVPGTYRIRLVVNDGSIDSAPDVVLVSTVNSPPVADAGDDQSAAVGAAVALDGSESSDADGDAISYAWTFLLRPPGSSAALDDPALPTPAFVVDVAGSYVVQLVVHDGFAASAPDTVTIATENSAPTADAGADRSVTAGTSVTLDGSGSFDPDGDALEFSWSFTSLPPGSGAQLTGATTGSPVFVADEPGIYVVQLIVSDGIASSAPDTVTISATAPQIIVGIVATDSVALEGSQDPGVLSISRLGPTAGDLVVAYALAGTAINGVDYETLSGSVTIPDGSESVEINVVPLDDALFEGPETVTLVIAPDPAYVIGLEQATVRITDDELPAVSIVASDDAAFEAGLDPGVFTVARTGPTDAPLTVFYEIHGNATNGTDYVALSGSVTIPSGSATSDITIAPIDDGIFEGTESVTLALSADPAYVVMVPGLAGLTIVDDDGAVVTIEATDPAASESGDTGTFTVRRTGGDLTASLQVIVARSGTASNGSDYAPIGGASFLVVIPANQLTATVTITPLADTVVEGNETVTLTISPRAVYVIGTPGSATVTIADSP